MKRPAVVLKSNSNHNNTTTASAVSMKTTANATVPMTTTTSTTNGTTANGNTMTNTVASSNKTSSSSLLDLIKNEWYTKNGATFGMAQLQILVILIIAYIGNNWQYSYPRNDNHNMTLFWFMNIALLIVSLCTMKHEPQPNIQILNRSQTEEWKGWMQWMFIMVRYMFVLLNYYVRSFV